MSVHFSFSFSFIIAPISCYLSELRWPIRNRNNQFKRQPTSYCDHQELNCYDAVIFESTTTGFILQWPNFSKNIVHSTHSHFRLMQNWIADGNWTFSHSFIQTSPRSFLCCWKILAKWQNAHVWRSKRNMRRESRIRLTNLNLKFKFYLACILRVLCVAYQKPDIQYANCLQLLAIVNAFFSRIKKSSYDWWHFHTTAQIRLHFNLKIYSS